MSRIKRGENPLKVWGDGSSIRDFAYSKDVAEGIILALYYMPDVAYINLGSGIGISIKELLETLKRVVPFEYEWDTTKSNGFPKRVMDVSLARGAIDYNPSTDLETGLRETWEWFNKNSNEYLNRKNYFREI
jgi:GDP-L-fucose synthase